ncbi:MAG: DUF4157 domain-containing protein [Paludibacteraceae bacterium]|nr:DUF4157 domain-containing protein [Paludibacteraceae bacterium]
MEYTYSNQDNTKKNNNCSRLSNISYPSRTVVHAKLEMTEPGDHDEQEADAVANTIAAGGKISRKFSGGSGSSGITVSNQMESQLNHLQGGGQAMPTGLRSMMESGFGQDFSHVRLHTDSEAASMSSSIHAKAFTHGNDIYFNQGQFSPNTTEGQKLMAHELTHVVQGSGKVGRNIAGDLMHSFFVDEKDYVETEETQKIISDNYIPAGKDERKPLTIILYTSRRADHNLAFRRDTGLNHLVKSETQSKVLFIQGKRSLEEYMIEIQLMVKLYGPLQNLILMGHGNIDGMVLDNDVEISTSSDSFFNLIKREFDAADKESSHKLTHSILFSECLTGANKHSPNGLTNHVKCLMPNVHVRGNLASTSDGQTYGHMDHEKKISTPDAPLSLLDDNDESSPVTGVCYTSANEGQRDRYTGPDMYGFLHDVKNYLEFEKNNQILPNLDSTRTIDSYLFTDAQNHVTRVILGADILRIIRNHISSDPKATLSFINYLLFSPHTFEPIQTVEGMFYYAKSFPLRKDIIYSK